MLVLEFIRWACGCTTASYTEPHLNTLPTGQITGTVNIRPDDDHQCMVCMALEEVFPSTDIQPMCHVEGCAAPVKATLQGCDGHMNVCGQHESELLSVDPLCCTY